MTNTNPNAGQVKRTSLSRGPERLKNVRKPDSRRDFRHMLPLLQRHACSGQIHVHGVWVAAPQDNGWPPTGDSWAPGSPDVCGGNFDCQVGGASNWLLAPQTDLDDLVKQVIVFGELRRRPQDHVRWLSRLACCRLWTRE